MPMSTKEVREDIACRFRNARNANLYLPIDATQKDIAMKANNTKARLNNVFIIVLLF